VAPDDTTFEYLSGRDHAPKGADWDAQLTRWRQLPPDDGDVNIPRVDVDAVTDSLGQFSGHHRCA
jgi:3-isopropylmalate/(R)-2-methylmalate dehydratase large subunit